MKSFKFIYLPALIAFLANYSLEINLSECDLEHSTICDHLNGTKSCCPVKQGICCQDVDFCCPKGFNCDSKKNRCVQDSLYIPFHLRLEKIDGESSETFSIKWLKKEQGQKINLENVPCPDKKTGCQTGSTCCQLNSGKYSCCPFPNAVCCKDHLHCCPNGYICDIKNRRCIKGDITLLLYQKTESIEIKEEKNVEYTSQKKLGDVKIKSVKTEVKNIKNECPDEQVECPGDSTCCQKGYNEWGCCPFENAVCCEDQLHCCPEGYTCDVETGSCHFGDVSFPFYQKIKSVKTEVKNIKNECPGEQVECPGDSTCCQKGYNEWGCCPFENAVCCEDQLHCCPEGYTCDVETGSCHFGDVSFPFYQKIKSVKTEVKNIKNECPGEQVECPGDSTCCQKGYNEWGCCPFENAVCCEDQLHCCPEGYTCDVETGSCHFGDVSFPFYQKIKSVKTEVKNIKNECPDEQVECPGDSTCCQKGYNEWGCCPFENAVCCKDQLHCCPEGYTCDVETGSCHFGDVSFPFYQKIKSVKT